MPAHYAHYYFGKQIIRSMPSDIKQLINNNRDCIDAFLIGLQGPDILFYYKPMLHNAVNREGNAIHNSSGTNFFRHAIKVTKRENSPEAYSYIIGSMCHYVLDSACHPIVTRNMVKFNATHAKIERVFDNMLIAEDNRKRFNLDTSVMFPYNASLGKVISPFYSNTTPRIINSSIGQMDRYLAMMCNSNRVVRTSLYDALSLLMINGVKDKRDMIVTTKPDHSYDSSSNELRDKLLETVPEAITEVEKLMDTILLGKPLSKRLAPNYLGE